MSDTPEYITARPVTLQEVQEWATAEVTPEPLFVPLDRQALTKQLTDLFFRIQHDTPIQITYFQRAEKFADKAMVLFGLENKDNK